MEYILRTSDTPKDAATKIIKNSSELLDLLYEQLKKHTQSKDVRIANNAKTINSKRLLGIPKDIKEIDEKLVTLEHPISTDKEHLSEAVNNLIVSKDNSKDEYLLSDIREKAGEYMGYTHGGKLPSLYFTKGHYTQDHNKQDHIGWHPCKENTDYFRKNIDKNSHNYYTLHRRTMTREEKTIFARLVQSDELKPTKGKGLFMEGYFNLDEACLHPSRGTFEEKSDGEDAEAEEAEAWKVITNGKLAKNEDPNYFNKE
jgi:hypothetical protein